MSNLGRKTLTPASTGARDGKVVATFRSKVGRDYEAAFSPTELATFISGLNAARERALKQMPEEGSEIFLPMQGVSVGESDTHILFRIHLNEFHHQDFAAEKGTKLAVELLEMGKRLGRGGS